jgi:hypothetical protein
MSFLKVSVNQFCLSKRVRQGFKKDQDEENLLHATRKAVISSHGG